MEPLNISITDLSLDTIIGSTYQDQPLTLGDAIVIAAAKELLAGADVLSVTTRIRQIRDEEIRASVKAEIERTMVEPVPQTNQWGEAVGKTTTLRALMVAEAENFFTEKRGGDSYNRGPRMTGAERVVAELVSKDLKQAIAAAFAEEKKKVVAVVQGKAAELLADAVKAGLR